MRNLTWSDEALLEAVKQAISWRQVLLMLNLSPQGGGGYATVQRRVKELNLDVSHFSGKHWNRGKHYPVRNLDKLLTVLERPIGSHGLKKKLFRAGLKTPKCEECGWCQVSTDGRIPVELDHINGNKLDNRIENLRILCPNCHSLKLTHRGCNKKSKDKNKIYITKPIILPETPGSEPVGIHPTKLPRVLKEKIDKYCKYCGNLLTKDGVEYCSINCRAQASRLIHLTKEVLEILIWEKPTSKIAAENGVSDSSIGKLCRKLGIDKPPPGYWAKVTNGIPHKEALEQCLNNKLHKQKIRDSLNNLSDDSLTKIDITVY